jgi:hypothetical protein
LVMVGFNPGDVPRFPRAKIVGLELWRLWGLSLAQDAGL